MPVPSGELPPAVADYLQGLEDRIAALESPGSPGKVFATTSALKPSAADFYQCVYLDTTLNILAHSDGTNWRRQDTGGTI